jgi:hypothetical protein
MDANKRLELINTWTENENRIQKLVNELEEAKRLKEKIEEEIPSLGQTGKWEIKFISPKTPSQAKMVVLPSGQEVSKSKKRKIKQEEAMRKKMSQLRSEGGGTILQDTGKRLDQSQLFNPPNN